jgi:hypothetical protein
VNYLRRFGAFWYDFLVGDRPELFVGSIALLAVTWALIALRLDTTVAGAVLLLAILLLGFSSVSLALRRRE